MRRLLVQGLVRPVPVVVLDVLPQHDGQVSPAGNQEPVGALSSCCSHPALRVRIHTWSLRRVLITSVPASARTVSNAPVYLASRSRIRNRTTGPPPPGPPRGCGRTASPTPPLG